MKNFYCQLKIDDEHFFVGREHHEYFIRCTPFDGAWEKVTPLDVFQCMCLTLINGEKYSVYWYGSTHDTDLFRNSTITRNGYHYCVIDQALLNLLFSKVITEHDTISL